MLGSRNWKWGWKVRYWPTPTTWKKRKSKARRGTKQEAVMGCGVFKDPPEPATCLPTKQDCGNCNASVNTNKKFKGPTKDSLTNIIYPTVVANVHEDFTCWNTVVPWFAHCVFLWYKTNWTTTVKVNEATVVRKKECCPPLLRSAKHNRTPITKRHATTLRWHSVTSSATLFWPPSTNTAALSKRMSQHCCSGPTPAVCAPFLTCCWPLMVTLLIWEGVMQKCGGRPKVWTVATHHQNCWLRQTSVTSSWHAILLLPVEVAVEAVKARWTTRVVRQRRTIKEPRNWWWRKRWNWWKNGIHKTTTWMNWSPSRSQSLVWRNPPKIEWSATILKKFKGSTTLCWTRETAKEIKNCVLRVSKWRRWWCEKHWLSMKTTNWVRWRKWWKWLVRAFAKNGCGWKIPTRWKKQWTSAKEVVAKRKCSCCCKWKTTSTHWKRDRSTMPVVTSQN